VTTTVTTQASQDGTTRVTSCSAHGRVLCHLCHPCHPCHPCRVGGHNVLYRPQLTTWCRVNTSNQRRDIETTWQFETKLLQTYSDISQFDTVHLHPVSEPSHCRVTESSLAQITMSQVTTCSQRLTASLPFYEQCHLCRDLANVDTRYNDTQHLRHL